MVSSTATTVATATTFGWCASDVGVEVARQCLGGVAAWGLAGCVQSDWAFARALRGEAITMFVNGGLESAKLILRDLVNATLGLDNSMHRMLSQSGNPT